MARTSQETAEAGAGQERPAAQSLTPQAVLEALRQLSPRERIWVIARALPEAERDLPRPGPRKSLLGALAEYGPAPSAEDIDEARREMWGGADRHAG